MSSAALEKSLDEIIGEKPADSKRGGSGRPSRLPGRDSRRTPYERDSREPRRDDRRSDADVWAHDRYSDRRDDRQRYRSRSAGRDGRAARLKVSNIHYDLSQEDVRNLFEKIGPVSRFNMRFDRAGRSEGIAFVTYERYSDATAAIKEYDGQKALGQILEVDMDAIVPPGRSGGSGRDLASRIGDGPRGQYRDDEPRRGDRGGRRGERRGKPRGGAAAASGGREKTSNRRGPVTADDLDAELDSYINARNNGDAQKVAESGPGADGGADGMQID